MLTYQTRHPGETGDFLIGYPTPGAPHVFTATGCASSEQIAKDECERLNEAQVAERRSTFARAADLIALDRES